MAEPIETSSGEQPGQSHREYLKRAVDVMSEAQDILQLERGTILQKVWQTGSLLGEVENDEEAYNLDQQMEFLLTMSGQYTIALRVLETVGGAALQALAQTGIQMPPPPTLIVPDTDITETLTDASGQPLIQGRKPRKKKG